jgi:sec-independent protein translocase protein TatA
MVSEWLQKMNSYCRNSLEGGQRLYTLGALEIGLIAAVVVLLFGAGKVAQIGGALGKSIREFRRERDKKDDEGPRLTTAESKGEKTVAQLQAKSGKNKFCPNCGEKIPENARFCPGCGVKIEVHS